MTDFVFVWHRGESGLPHVKSVICNPETASWVTYLPVIDRFRAGLALMLLVHQGSGGRLDCLCLIMRPLSAS